MQPLWFTKMLERMEPVHLQEWYERKMVLHTDAGYSLEHSECLALLLVISTQSQIVIRRKHE